MIGEGWTIEQVEEFANDYGLTMNIKDIKNNKIADYSSYLDEVVVAQNRTGKIASGVAFSVTIDVDLSSYNLVINYIDRKTSESLADTKTEKKKDGDSGMISCPGFKGYAAENSNISYEISGKDVTVNCYYSKVVDENISVDENL